MKKATNILTMAALGFTFACSNAPEETVETTEKAEMEEMEMEDTDGTYALMTEGDEVMWTGYKVVGGDSHNGTLQVKDGEFMTKDGKLVGGKFTIDMNSLTNEDLEKEGEKAKLVGHLKSPDFFNVGEYPEAMFTITGAQKAENGENGVTHNISGNLKMRGQENNITFPAKVDMTDDMIQISTPEFAIDRTKWDVKYGSENIEGLAKDKMISNNVKLKIDVKAKKS